ncbi:MAG TPA: hypothetical protein VMI31_01100 [Fimbriimonadaceae bacterium]|nr:hypothetical protein [Fimbriimonadaceae bacterium]
MTRTAALLAIALPVAANAQTYRLLDLGTLGGSTSNALGINSHGVVVGSSTTAGGLTHGFVFSGGSMQDIGTLGGTASTARGINDSGVIVGDADTGDNHDHAFIYDGATMQDIGTLAGVTSEAFAINNSGGVVGTSSTSTVNVFHAISYSNGVLSDLGTLPGGDFSYANSVNDSGIVVGNSNNSVQTEKGFIYQNGAMSDIGTLPNTNMCNALQINASGQVAGFSYTASLGEDAWIKSGGVFTDLGSLGGDKTWAYGLNDLGQVVGGSYVNSTDYHGYLYSGGTIHDLNSMLDASGAGWTVLSCRGINDGGQIAASATFAGGQMHAVLLTPVPEPSALLVSAAGIALLLLRGFTCTRLGTLRRSAAVCRSSSAEANPGWLPGTASGKRAEEQTSLGISTRAVSARGVAACPASANGCPSGQVEGPSRLGS